MSAQTFSARTGLALLAALVVMLPVVVMPPQAANALSQWCGPPTPGVDSAYQSGRGNGHPDGEPDNLVGWGGAGAVGEAAKLVRDLEWAAKFAGIAEGLAAEAADIAPTPGNTVLSVVAQVANLTKLALEESKFLAELAKTELERKHERIDACGAVLTADLVDVIFIASMEEELAALDLTASSDEDGSGVAAGVRTAPSAMFMLPQDGLPAWQQDASLYAGYSGGGHSHDGLMPGGNPVEYQHGMLNANHIGLATVVRNEIALLDHHGIDVGGSSVYDPRTRQWTTVPGAKEMWEDAMDLFAAGDLSRGYQELARAYQTAVTASAGSTS